MVEFALTAGVIAYLQRANLPLLRINHDAVPAGEPEAAGDADRRPSGWRWGVVALIVMGALTPLGLIAPGSAFGEAAPGNLNLQRYHLSAVPDGLRHWAGFWHHAIFRGYDFGHDKHPAVGYALSALVGIAAIAVAAFAVVLLIRLLQRHREQQPSAAPVQGAPRAHRTGTPRWMIDSQPGLCPCGCTGRRSKVNYVEKTIGGAAVAMRNAMFSDDVAARRGLLQRIEPRVKLASLLALLLAAAMVRHIPVLVAMYAGTLVLAALPALPLGFFVRSGCSSPSSPGSSWRRPPSASSPTGASSFRWGTGGSGTPSA